MKKFKFNLESVLKYRASIERQEKGVLSGLNAQLAQLLDELDKLYSDYKQTAGQFESAMSGEGMSVYDIRAMHALLENIEFFIEKKLAEIEAQNRLISRQTMIVTRAMRETKTMDRLKEIKYDEYVKSEAKEQEKFIEEFAAHQKQSAINN